MQSTRSSFKTLAALTLCTSLVVPATAAAAVENTDSYQLQHEVVRIDQPRPMGISDEIWKKFGWWLFEKGGQYVESLIKLDGKTVIDRSKVYLVSPLIAYNSGNIGPEFFFRPRVTSNAKSIRMHSHRIFALDVFSKMALILLRPNGTTAISKTVNSNQYMFFDLNGKNLGSWKAQYITTNGWSWQNYFWMGLKGKASKSISSTNHETEGISYSSDGRVFFYEEAQESELGKEKRLRTSLSSRVLSFEELAHQFENRQGVAVDSLRDFEVGEYVIVSGIIKRLEFDPIKNRTKFGFDCKQCGGSDKEFSWEFQGDLTSRYKADDRIAFNFQVVEIGRDGMRIFEGLDFFEEVFSLSDRGFVPSIDDYVVTVDELQDLGVER